MKKINKFIRYRLLRYFSDKFVLKLMYLVRFRKFLNLKDPKTFTEKMQWLKLNNQNPLHTTCADKYMVRDFVKKRIGNEYLIPLLFSEDNPFKIPFNTLPYKYIIKTNHGSGGNIIVVKDKMFFKGKWLDFSDKVIKKELNRWLKSNYYIYSREWEYKNISPRVIIEELLDDNLGNNMLSDYKIHCFEGVPCYIQTIHDRETVVKETWYDTNWEIKDMNYFSREKKMIEKPNNLEELIDVAQKLSKGFNYVRVDLYSVRNKIYFGELTFHPYSGLIKFYNPKWDEILGEKLNIEKTKEVI